MVLALKQLHAQVRVLQIATPSYAAARPHDLRSKPKRTLVTRSQLEDSPSGSSSPELALTPAVPTLMGAQKPKAPVDPSIAKNMLEYINASWTPYHAVGKIYGFTVEIIVYDLSAILLRNLKHISLSCQGQNSSYLLPEATSGHLISSSDEGMSCILQHVWVSDHEMASMPFADEASKRLKAAGFQKLSERQSWKGLKTGGKYYFTRNASTIVAFAIGNKFAAGNGFHMIGAHTDRCEQYHCNTPLVIAQRAA